MTLHAWSRGAYLWGRYLHGLLRRLPRITSESASDHTTTTQHHPSEVAEGKSEKSHIIGEETFSKMAMLTTMVADMKEHFVIDPLISKRQQLLLATQLCRMVLKVCCLLHCHIPYFSRSLLFPSRTTTLLWPLAFPYIRPYAGPVLVWGAGNPSAHEYGSQLSHKRACKRTVRLHGYHEP
jgi:hypothetical protein